MQIATLCSDIEIRLTIETLSIYEYGKISATLAMQNNYSLKKNCCVRHFPAPVCCIMTKIFSTPKSFKNIFIRLIILSTHTQSPSLPSLSHPLSSLLFLPSVLSPNILSLCTCTYFSFHLFL